MGKPENILWDAVSNGDVKLVKYLIQRYEIDVHCRGYRNHNLIYFAESKEMIELLKSLGLDINEKDEYGKTALHYSQNEKKAKILIECGADPNILDDKEQDYRLCLNRRMINRRWNENQIIKEANKESSNNGKHIKKSVKKNKTIGKDNFNYADSIKKQIENQKITLHDACSMGDTSLVFTLFFEGADINEKDYLGNTPLHYASTELIASMLINKGADMYAKNNADVDPCEYVRSGDENNKIGKYIFAIRKRKEQNLGM